jgi:hypothetical protein
MFLHRNFLKTELLNAMENDLGDQTLVAQKIIVETEFGKYCV